MDCKPSPPQLMMDFTQVGQTEQAMLEAHDRRLAVSWRRRRQNRADILVPNTNAWESGRTAQTRLAAIALKR